MDLPELTFPITVDFIEDSYWIGAVGPFKYGEAATAFLAGEGFTASADDDALTEELAAFLKDFGGSLKPYAHVKSGSDIPKAGPADCLVGYGFLTLDVGPVPAERYIFSSLRDFLYVELGKAILKGNAPRQCRLCGNWFLHGSGDRAMYCERTAPGEDGRTCREAGARAVFEKKIQEEAWKLYKRAYKKYYARFMKGNLSRDDFKAWTEQAAADRDAAIERMSSTSDAEERAKITEQLQKQLNKL